MKPMLTATDKVMIEFMREKPLNQLSAALKFACLDLVSAARKIGRAGLNVRSEYFLFPSGKRAKRYWVEA